MHQPVLTTVPDRVWLNINVPIQGAKLAASEGAPLETNSVNPDFPGRRWEAAVQQAPRGWTAAAAGDVLQRKAAATKNQFGAMSSLLENRDA